MSLGTEIIEHERTNMLRWNNGVLEQCYLNRSLLEEGLHNYFEAHDWRLVPDKGKEE